MEAPPSDERPPNDPGEADARAAEVAAVELMTHLCGGWYRCPRCPRIYCACSLGRCYSCGARTAPDGSQFFDGDPREVRKQNGSTTLRYVGEPSGAYRRRP